MKRTFAILTILFISIWLLFLFSGYTLVLPFSVAPEKTFTSDIINAESKIQLFSEYDFSKDNWVAYLVISHQDKTDLNPQLARFTCLKCSDKRVLNEMKKSWVFKVSGGDVATVTSNFYLFKNNKLVYETGIVIDKNFECLQNSVYGEMVPVQKDQLVNVCKKFTPVYWPVVLL